MLGHVIVVSRARDLPINRLSIPAVTMHLPAPAYSIIVPNHDLPRFRATLPGEVTVVAEESLLSGWTLKRIQQSLPPSVAARAGWYLQQLLKIEAVRQLPGDSEALVWDGDTIPLRPIEFKDAAGRIGFYTGREHHEPYFQATRRLFGSGRMIPRSFIAQCMYVRVRWIHELLGVIEGRAGSGWGEAILGCVPGLSPSEFSEYETIGTFVAGAFPAQMFINHRPWFRWGMAYFGSIDQVRAAGLGRLARSYDYVALESWDRGPAAWVRSRLQRFLDGLTRHGGLRRHGAIAAAGLRSR
jgi:hypothetical protein